jgi:(E)-4-hydroxy-3-methylbut-2-enyl-diphosphate synthase
MSYCIDLLNRKRLSTKEVRIGNVTMGALSPIRLQSMTTTDTMNTEASVAQSIRMIEAGCELVRLTAPSKNEAINLGVIKKALNEKGYNTPLVADIHFTPNAAEIAAGLVEKVRVNPGNYADKKKFEEIEYTDESYESELLRIEEKFTPLVLLCKKHGTAMRIGTNHGSLSDRILSRYGDTPAGMVQSAMEFIRICEKLDFDQLVISMKASNTIVMVQAYRLLVAEMLKRGEVYPLHLGVTEAGDGEDGRIKSAVGIGALLEDGIGDTIRVSLTEEPEFEIPVARKLAEKCQNTDNIKVVAEEHTELPYNPFEYERSNSFAVHNIGNHQVPVVIGDMSNRQEITPASLYGLGYVYSVPLDKWNVQDLASDYIFVGDNVINFELPGTLGVITTFELWQTKHQNKPGFYPLLTNENLSFLDKNQKAFLLVNAEDEVLAECSQYTQLVLVVQTKFANKTQLFRQFRLNYAKKELKNPVIMRTISNEKEAETFQLAVSADMGSTFIDGFGDGIWISAEQPLQLINSTSFGILQATRTRISKTEYISCPSCGRTLFDLQETTAKIREKTSHLKGVKIGIMGCIVNGPGEMADADYGYVGTGPGKINLYKEKTVVKRNIPENDAVQALIDLIKEHGDWVEVSH